ncbi:hypothetical protein HYT84_03400 [Candidatus Micrarchaeota archaeon]|nr:hypothetical protein [Candidatus Micrarchaeota archaeon]
MGLVSREEILKNGFVEIRVRVAGIIQRHKFNVVREETPFGSVPYLVVKAMIPHVELVRIAEEIQLPVRNKEATVFPKGKMVKDFAGL